MKELDRQNIKSDVISIVMNKVDYGYIEGTGSKDGNEIDVYKGSLPKQEVTGILCTFDLYSNINYSNV